MGLFGRRKQKLNHGVDMPVMRLQTDIHSHVLPGIDDGAANIDESLEMVKAFIRLGYTKIICSPHIHSDRYRNTRDSIQSAYNELMKGMEAENLHLQVEFAAEYHLDNEFLALIKKDDIISFGSERYVLVEFSFNLPPVGVDRVFNLLTEKGYQPVVAHPERYEYWHGNASLFERLRSIGYLFQSNIHAASGAYGVIPQRIFQMLAKNGWIDFLGSDAHDARSVSLLNQSIELPIVQTVLQKGVRNPFL